MARKTAVSAAMSSVNMSREQRDVKYVKQTTVVETVCVCTGANRGGAGRAGTTSERFITETTGERMNNNNNNKCHKSGRNVSRQQRTKSQKPNAFNKAQFARPSSSLRSSTVRPLVRMGEV